MGRRNATRSLWLFAIPAAAQASIGQTQPQEALVNARFETAGQRLLPEG